MFGGNCPNCSALIHWVEVENVAGKTNDVENWNCFLHKCPSCNTILSVQINPIEIERNITYQIEKIKDNPSNKRKAPINLLRD